jgi:hypothetical protein
LAFHSGREADHSPPSSAEVKEWVELYLYSPNTPSWRGAQLGGAQGQLFLYLVLERWWNPLRQSYLSGLVWIVCADSNVRGSLSVDNLM